MYKKPCFFISKVGVELATSWILYIGRIVYNITTKPSTISLLY